MGAYKRKGGMGKNDVTANSLEFAQEGQSRSTNSETQGCREGAIKDAYNEADF